MVKPQTGMTTRLKRRIGVFDDGVQGPLIIALSCLHGNEFLPYRAIDYTLKMLEVEHITNPEFIYHGRFVGFCANMAAAKAGQRYIDRDLNRIWTEELIENLANKSYIPKSQEEKELQSIWNLIKREVQRYSGDQVIILDFHTTSAEGGIFCMPAHDEGSLNLAFQLYIPVVEGLLDTVSNSCLSFMTESHLGKPTTAMSIEVGQHADINSIYVAIATMINSMRSAGAARNEDVESRHDDILRINAEGLPRVSRLDYIHEIKEGDEFVMEPGFKNFQFVPKGTLLAKDRQGPIYCPEDRILLMPLYQSKGAEGFFLVQIDLTFGNF